MDKATFKIKGVEYEFKDITLKSYYELQNILINPEKGSEYKIVSLITDCPVEQLLQLKYKDWLMIWEETQIQVTKIKGNTQSINPIIEFKGVKYGLPNIDEMTVGEFADLDIILNSENAERRLEEIAAVVYRPVIKQKGNQLELAPYDTEGFKERRELFLDLPITAIRSANSFFLQYANLSLKSTLESLVNTPEMKMLPEKDQELLQSLVQVDLGGELSIAWLEKILFDFQKLRSYRLDPVLTGLPGKKTKLQRLISSFRNKKIKDN